LSPRSAAVSAAVAEASRLSTCGQDGRTTAGKMPALRQGQDSRFGCCWITQIQARPAISKQREG